VAKANLILPNGTKVTIDGTADEVSILLTKFSASVEQETPREKVKIKSSKKLSAPGRKQKAGPIAYITELEKEGFFKLKRSLPDIQKKLEEKGHIYAQTSLSPALVRLVRKRILRRIKEKKGWLYVS